VPAGGSRCRILSGWEACGSVFLQLESILEGSNIEAGHVATHPSVVLSVAGVCSARNTMLYSPTSCLCLCVGVDAQQNR